MLQVAGAARFRNGAHAQDVTHALCGGNNAARVKQVEGMGALQHVVVGWQRQTLRQNAVAFCLVTVKFAEKQIGIGNFEVISRELFLVLQENVAIREHGTII